MRHLIPCLLMFQPMMTAWPDDISIPLEIRERFWEQEPGPVRDSDDAPRLLVIYPAREMKPTSHKETRYAGRVDPPDSIVKLNGEEIKVYKGGVFTGLHPLPLEGQGIWKFEASKENQRTIVERKLQRLPDIPPTSKWPLEFHHYAVWPSGEYILPADQVLGIAMFASEGHQASFRLGRSSSWEPMKIGKNHPERGGRYLASIDPPEPSDQADGLPELHKVWFRLEGKDPDSGNNDQPRTITHESNLSIGNMAGHQAIALTTEDHNSFLKDRTSWDRYGNWPGWTWFPIRGIYDERIMVDFGVGETGWIELVNADIKWGENILPLPLLGQPVFHHLSDRVTFEWPYLRYPVACVLRHENSGEEVNRLSVSFPGAGRVAGLNLKLAQESPAYSYKLGRPGPVRGRKSAPQLDLNLKSDIWGYQIRHNEGKGMKLVVRTPPSLLAVTQLHPLKGLRVMIDAGHGGHNEGGVGPSGVTEADLNLVQAAWLARDLQGLGAQVIHTRSDDTFISLDQRVREAEHQEPDLFISLHHNSVAIDQDPFIDRGPVVYYHYDHACRLAEVVAVELNRLLTPQEKPRARKQNFRVIRNISLCPAILVETAFVCHPEDEWMLRQDETHQKTAAAIAAGIRKLIEPRSSTLSGPLAQSLK
jgi:N-acetylmuramoyl-L-alanine amidase